MSVGRSSDPRLGPEGLARPRLAHDPLPRRGMRGWLREPGVLGLALGLSLGAGFAWLVVGGERPDWLRLPVAPSPAALPAETVSEPPPAPAPDVAAPQAQVAAARPALASDSGRSDGPWVQLAALPTLRQAEQTWTEIREQHAGLLARHEPRIQRIERDGGELFRLRVGPFASQSAAADLCRALRTEHASCYVAAGL